MKNIFIYLIIINILTFLLFAVDKVKAIKNKWRVQEKTLLFFSFVGGAFGAILAMYLFNHKTRKVIFFVLIPFFLLLQLVVIWYFIN